MNKDQLYEMAKQEWIRNHPAYTHKEYEQAMMAIARKLGI